MKLNKIILFLYIITLTSCNLICFEDEKITCSLQENQDSFNEEYILFYFSSSCSHIEAEDNISLLENSKSVNIDFKWNNNTLKVKPQNDWKNGCIYQLIFDGNLLINSQNIQVYIKRNFYFGKKTLIPIIIESTIEYPKELNAPIKIDFSKKMDRESFYDNIDCYPTINFKISFINDDKTLIITPKENWKANEFYKLSFANLHSTDFYYLENKEISFRVLKDIEIPQLIDTCRVTKIDNDFYFENLGNDFSKIKKDDSIAFIFSKKMNFESVKNGFSISPHIEGNIIDYNSDGKTFIFIPEKNYQANIKYEISLSKKIKDINDIELFDVYNFIFTPKLNFLKIDDIKVND